MFNFIKKYWDILGGTATGLILAYLARFKLERIQLIYSIIILILVSIGFFKIIKQSVEKGKIKRNTIVDNAIDGQRAMKAINLATNPTRDGEALGKLTLEIMRGSKLSMKKLKIFFDKFKGYLLAGSLTVLGIVEACGGLINDLFQDKLIIDGVEILPIVTLAAAVLVGAISNGFTKEQNATIKALFAKGNTNDLVVTEIKKTLKDKKARLTALNKAKSTSQSELKTLNDELSELKRSYDAKKQLCLMTPPLATEEDVRNVSNEVDGKTNEIRVKEQQLNQIDVEIERLNTTINALQNQL